MKKAKMFINPLPHNFSTQKGVMKKKKKNAKKVNFFLDSRKKP
jgi:hypothetical protein